MNSAYSSFDPLLQMRYGNEHWVDALAGKRVLVVSPFAQSIQSQYARKSKVDIVADFLPDFDLLTLQPPVTFAGEGEGRLWANEFRATVRRMAGIDFDVALVSAGSYGAPLAAAAATFGAVGIHVGGGLQLFFGITGKRWESYEVFEGNRRPRNWVRPSLAERPSGYNQVEDGCYW